MMRRKFLGSDSRARLDIMRRLKRGLPEDALAYVKWMCPKCKPVNVAFYTNANRLKRCAYCKSAVPKGAERCSKCGASL